MDSSAAPVRAQPIEILSGSQENTDSNVPPGLSLFPSVFAYLANDTGEVG